MGYRTRIEGGDPDCAHRTWNVTGRGYDECLKCGATRYEDYISPEQEDCAHRVMENTGRGYSQCTKCGYRRKD